MKYTLAVSVSDSPNIYEKFFLDTGKQHVWNFEVMGLYKTYVHQIRPKKCIG